MPQNQEQKMALLNRGPTSAKGKGGFITLPFIIVNESLERMVSFALIASLIQHLTGEYRMSVAGGTKLVNFWSAANNFLPVVGAFLADSFLGKFLTIGFGTILSFLGVVVLWLTTMIPNWMPPPCHAPPGECEPATRPQYAILLIAFALMSLGAGGVRPCTQAFGADQLDTKDESENRRALETFFNWYYACTCLSVLIGMTLIVGIIDKYGWRVGLLVEAGLMLVSIATIFAGSSLYVMAKPGKSLFTSFAQVMVAACKNRSFVLPPRGYEVQYYHGNGSTVQVPGNKLRFLNRACIVRNPVTDLCLDGSARNPWRLTSVEEVEGLKALIRVLPIWASGIVLGITSSAPFLTIQAQAMDRHVTSTFIMPAPSYGMFGVIVIVVWVPVYDRLILPLASKLRGKPVRLGLKVKMGMGLFVAFLAMVVAAIVEGTRRSRAVHGDPVVMSAFWLVPQYSLTGLAESFNAIGQAEFYYSQCPKSMSSISTSLVGLGMSVGALLANAVISMADGITRKDGSEGWFANDINKGHYDYYYWLMAGFNFVSLLYFVVCSWAYGPMEMEPETKDTTDQTPVD